MTSREPVKSREIALKALVRFERDQAYLNLFLPSLLKDLSIADRALAVQLVQGTVERLNTLDWVLNHFSTRNINKMTPWLRNLLRLGAYQLLYLDGIPPYAAIDQAVRLAHRYGHRGVAGLANALLRRIERDCLNLPWPDSKADPVDHLSLRYSIPGWLVKRVISRKGFTAAEEWCEAANLKPPLAIRPNRLRVETVNLIRQLKEEGFRAELSPLVPGMLRLPGGGGSPANSKAFAAGLFTIQGESSALVAPVLKPRSDEIILDLCSAPGGKTTHLAELTFDEGLIYALEIHPGRSSLVEKACRRLGLKSVQVLNIDGRRVSELGIRRPNAVLVDAPCSGLGVIGRLPEIKWRRREEDIVDLQKLQLELLTAAANILEPGGRLIYSVCTTEPEETTLLVERFKLAFPGFQPELPLEAIPVWLKDSQPPGTLTIEPQIQVMDGFFIAGWAKKGSIW